MIPSGSYPPRSPVEPDPLLGDPVVVAAGVEAAILSPGVAVAGLVVLVSLDHLSHRSYRVL